MYDGSLEEKNLPTTLKGAIDEARAKLNAGLKFGADQMQTVLIHHYRLDH